MKWQRKSFYDTNILVPMLKIFFVFIAENTVASVSDEVTKYYYTNILVPMLKNFFVFIVDKYYRFRLQWSNKEKKFYDTNILLTMLKNFLNSL